jgi:RND family efflux transporter MFP subunit
MESGAMMRYLIRYCLFVLLVMLVLAACSKSSGGRGDNEEAAMEERVVTVSVTPSAKRSFVDRIAVQGNLQAKDYAMVSPRIDGVITGLFVEEGDRVTANETALLQIDKVKVQEALEISRQDLSLARLQIREAEANLKSLQAQYDKAKIDYERFLRLREKDAVTQDAIELQETRYKATSAGLEHAVTLVDLAAEQAIKAEAALRIAEKNFEDSLIYAPIDGYVSMRFLKQGEFAGAGKPALRIDNPAVLEMSAFLPAEYYARIRVGETLIRIRAHGVDAGVYPVIYKSPTIQEMLRTFEIKCLIDDPADGVVPGAMADIEVRIEERSAVGVPSNAVMMRAGRKIVFTIEDDRARMLSVETGLESDGWVEIINGGLPEGAPVVTMGQNLIDDGVRIVLHGEDA